MPIEQYDAVATSISLGLAALSVTTILECWRPGRTHDEQGRAIFLNRDCCGTLYKRAMVIPFILVVLLALIMLDFAQQDDVCLTPMGYCASISCVCGNIIWQGYVFMFVSLTLSPVLLLTGALRGSKKRLCCGPCVGRRHVESGSGNSQSRSGCLGCGAQYDRLGHGDAPLLTAHEFLVVWPFLLGCTTICLTGMMPYLLQEHGITMDVINTTDELHNLGVFSGVLLPLLTCLFLGIQRAYQAAGYWDARRQFLFFCSRATPTRGFRYLGESELDTAEEDSASQSSQYEDLEKSDEKMHGSTMENALVPSRSAGKGCCGRYWSSLGRCNHNAWAAIGYLIIIPIVIAGLFMMIATLRSSRDAVTIYDICILSEEPSSCAKSDHCVWNSTITCATVCDREWARIKFNVGRFTAPLIVNVLRAGQAASTPIVTSRRQWQPQWNTSC
eukprot:INCI2725.1.p1 GENE.INCI2725.1~~INCI2725.1.p1  ORF type:complete len:444 (-),score=39.42 INCI2725.1:248-1579(-)